MKLDEFYPLNVPIPKNKQLCFQRPMKIDFCELGGSKNDSVMSTLCLQPCRRISALGWRVLFLSVFSSYDLRGPGRVKFTQATWS